MTTESIPAKNDVAKVLLKHCDAMDLLLGHMIDILSNTPHYEELRGGAFKVINELHVSVRKHVIADYPEYDVDRS